jgi:Ricin-type beta-trefoil lectin domain
VFNWESFGIQGIGTNSAGSRCVDVAGGRTADQTPVQLFACNGTGAQQWEFRNGAIINPQSGKCLDVFDDPAVTLARIRTCGAIDPIGQLWVIR